MQIKVFTIPVYNSDEFSKEMNNFLKNHKILKIESSVVHKDDNAAWSFCVHYTEGPQVYNTTKKGKVDYKEKLAPDDFVKFLVLRKVRKEISSQEGVLPFSLYNDEQMAAIAELDEITGEKMASIKGIGQKRVERFGEKIITAFNREMENEKSHKSDK